MCYRYGFGAGRHVYASTDNGPYNDVYDCLTGVY